MQQSMEGMAQCPHCAHNAPRSHFGTQAQTAGLLPVRRRVSQALPEAPEPVVFQPQQPVFKSSAPAPHYAAWPGMQPAAGSVAAPVARMVLQPSQALMPVGEPPAHAEFVTPEHQRGSPWKNAFILLTLLLICGVAAWLWWDQAQAPPVVVPPVTSSPSPQPEVRPAQIATKTESAVTKIALPDVDAHAADAKALITELFAADTPQRRAACIHEAEKHAAEIEGLLGANAEKKVELRLLARIPGLPLSLPSGRLIPLFRVVTSQCANGALIRLETGADGKRRIHWPLFYETHEAKLTAFISQPGDAGAWLHAGLRPSHGLDIPAELRPKYLTFDVQVSASSTPHYVACVERDTPLGRFLDRETDWGKSYLARLLVRRLDIRGDAPCLIVMDCEGAKEGGEVDGER